MGDQLPPGTSQGNGQLRYEYILRIPNILPGSHAAMVERALAAFARNMSGASLSKTLRRHYSDHAMHVSRRKVV